MDADKDEMEWQEIECLNGQVFIRVPVNWKQPSEKRMVKKFSYGARPQEIYGDFEEGAVLTLNLFDRVLSEEQVYPAIREIQRLIGHLYPESVKVTAREIRTDAGKAGWFAFVTGGIKADTIHYMFVMPADEKMLFGSYHSPQERECEDRRIFLEIMKRIGIKSRK